MQTKLRKIKRGDEIEFRFSLTLTEKELAGAESIQSEPDTLESWLKPKENVQVQLAGMRILWFWASIWGDRKSKKRFINDSQQRRKSRAIKLNNSKKRRRRK